MTIVSQMHDGVKCEEFSEVIKIDEGKVRQHVEEVVRQSVEETLNGLLEAEADELCGAKRYQRSVERLDTRAGHYERKLQTKAGEVALKVPRLRNMPFETQIIERYRRRESSIEEAMIEMYLAGVSVRRVEDITEALWGTRVSPSTVSELNQKIYVHIDAWRNRPIEGEHPYVYLDGIWLKRSWGGEVENIAVLVAIAVGADGYREIIAVCEGTKEDKESWRNFLRHLKERGLKGVRMIISDKCLGLVEALGEFFPERSGSAAWSIGKRWMLPPNKQRRPTMEGGKDHGWCNSSCFTVTSIRHAQLKTRLPRPGAVGQIPTPEPGRRNASCVMVQRSHPLPRKRKRAWNRPLPNSPAKG